ncbi:hypothetical protein H6G45_06555 [Synechocystis sp. FACHB-383]|uniref:hypothetical protein n=1 Tax=unclassified Synechocystis TaxID=2640012 RepID=UPI001689CBEA|nr:MULTISPECIES: hypothetical protein [unclassified Synechocystis]MBD2653153.1 hypothetical protein [Synechocystis sp. FACHB-383]MBE9194650.1 hypothetical protein [Synechocystis sp. LEGE 06083]
MFTKFNQVLLASGLVIGSAVMLSPAAFANPTNSEGDGIGVEVPEVELLTWTATKTPGTPEELTLYTALSETVVGTVNVKSNDAAGFTVAVTSDNEGILKTGDGVASYLQMPYTLYYGPNGSTASVTLTSGEGTAETPAALIADCASSTGCDRDVAISVLQSNVNGKAHGIYSDTLTFTLTNK